MARTVEIKEAKALITGGASGIGLATAARLAAKGSIPIIVDINEGGIREAIESLQARGWRAYGFRADVTDIDQLRSLRNDLEGIGLAPDILINCAGLTLVAHVCSMNHSEWCRIMDVNLMGTINSIEAFLPSMLERGRGHIVNMGSIAGLLPIPGLAAYCASKFAITGLSEVLRFDLKHCGIGVSLICPGYVNTPMSSAHPVKDLPIRFRGWERVYRLIEMFGDSAENMARQVVSAIEDNRFMIIPGLPSRIFYHYRRLFPRLAGFSGLAYGRLYNWLRKRTYKPLPA